MNSLSHLHELELLQASLLPTETLAFLPSDHESPWPALLTSHSASPSAGDDVPSIPAHFQVRTTDSGVYLEILLSEAYPEEQPYVTVHGAARAEADAWAQRVEDGLKAVGEEGTE